MIAIKIPKTQYSTVSYARLMSVEMPFAEAHRGAPFNQKNGPAIALVGAYASISAGAALFSTSMLLGGLMIAGGVMSGLGALTGNQTLSTLGMVASIAGGIGAGLQGAAGTAGEGGFWNPFSENSIAFSNTKFGQAFKGVTDAFSSSNSAGGQVIDAAKGIDASAIQGSIESSSNGAIIRDISNNVTSGGTLAQQANDFSIGSALTDSVGGKSGLLTNASSMFGDKGLMGAVSGAADAYQNQPLINAQVDRLEQGVENDQFAISQQQQRMNNMKAQPTVNIGVNPNAQIFNEQPAQQNKYAVAINGEVRYLSQSEYDAMKQSQAQSGLLQQGAVA